MAAGRMREGDPKLSELIRRHGMAFPLTLRERGKVSTHSGRLRLIRLSKEVNVETSESKHSVVFSAA